jgi:hypothetical protein
LERRVICVAEFDLAANGVRVCEFGATVAGDFVAFV